ncbi:MAG: ThuA domain-containing protein, partial [Pseudomonadota bacterium]
MTQTKTLLVTKGHPFEKGPFFEWMESFAALDVTHVEHPAAEAFIGAGLGDDYGLWVFYDMPGYVFGGADGVTFVEPSHAFKAAVVARAEAGGPILFMHHALAGWPTWPAYGDMVGGRFLYRPGQVRGQAQL